jgi:toxin ParE1/3/4
MKKVTFHPDADAEVIEAARYNEMRSEGLGLSFLIELEAAIEQVVINPEGYQRIGSEVRRKTIQTLPFITYYM